MSIVEVLIAFGLAAMLGWVLADQQATQLKNNAFNQSVMTAMDLKSRLGMILRDDQAWSNIVVQNSAGGVNAAGAMDCLGNNTSCSARIASPLAFKIYGPSSSTDPFESFTDGAANQPGFTNSGQSCDDFNDSAAGHATCVFGYKITWEVDSPCAGTCLNPPVRIIARLVHRPLPGITVLNTEKYSYAGANAFIRAGKATALRWIVEHRVVTPVGPPGNGGGVCSTVGPYGAPRLLTTASDPFSLLSGSGTATITVNARGTFNCTFSATSYATDTFTGHFFVNGAWVQSTVPGSASNAARLSGTVSQSVNFTTTTASFTFELWQVCQTAPGFGDDNFGLGLPTPISGPYTSPYVFATVNCASVIN